MINAIDHPNLWVSVHPVIRDKMTKLRDETTCTKEFRELTSEISSLICYEALRDACMKDKAINTPLKTIIGETLAEKYAIIPILRAGMGMLDGLLRVIPTAKVGHIGAYRDPSTLQPHEYYCKLPANSNERKVFLIDPMLATGGTAKMSIDLLKEKGVTDIRFLCLVAAGDGTALLQKHHPDVGIYSAAYDAELNDHGYIVPGLGDAGDRIYGTK